jgi:hypothetical protein
MTLDQRALEEAERWLRAKLRGTTPLLPHEFDLFSALAERQNARGEFYLPVDTPGPAFIDAFVDMMPTTLPPPSSGAHRDLIQMSRVPVPAPKRKR